MPDATEFIKIIKKTALEAIEAKKPVHICFGKVTNVFPLKIAVEQKLFLGEAQLVLTSNVSDYETEITSRQFLNSPDASDDKGSVGQEGFEKTLITVHNGLAPGDEVILVRQQDGQKYIVLDKIR